MKNSKKEEYILYLQQQYIYTYISTYILLFPTYFFYFLKTPFMVSCTFKSPKKNECSKDTYRSEKRKRKLEKKNKKKEKYTHGQNRNDKGTWLLKPKKRVIASRSRIVIITGYQPSIYPPSQSCSNRPFSRRNATCLISYYQPVIVRQYIPGAV